MLLVIAVVIAALYVAKWASAALPAGRWYTIGLALAGIIMMPVLSLIIGLDSPLSHQVGVGVLAATFLFPVYVWFYRSRRPTPQGAPLDALKETPAWREAEQTVARAFETRQGSVAEVKDDH